VTHSTAIEPHIFENEQRETVTANADHHRDMLNNFLHLEMDAHTCETCRSAKKVAKYQKASTSTNLLRTFSQDVSLLDSETFLGYHGRRT
jgi:hypothetical protein